MNIRIIKLHIENFKGIRDMDISFSEKTNIKGQNASGKTTIFDSVSWLLWNKDSLGSEKFSIRPLDEDGNVKHFLDIKVSAIIQFNDDEYEITKIQKEKWVKRRGSETQEYAGNINEYEINGYPKSEKEYKAFIAENVSEENFKLITNPMAFVSLPWKEQRKILFGMVDFKSDYEIAIENEKFSKIAGELKIATIEDIRAKNVKALSGLKKQQSEIPSRIDEVSKQIKIVDVSDLELKKNAIKEDIENLKVEIEEAEKENQSYSKKMDTLFNLKLDMSQIENECNRGNVDKFREIERNINDLQNKINLLKNKNFVEKQNYEKLKKELAESESKRRDLGQKYNQTKSMQFDEKGCFCSLCGQEYPEEKKSEIKSNFENTKAIRMQELIKTGNDLVAKEKLLRKEIDAYTSSDYSDEINDLEKQIERLNIEKEETLKPSDPFENEKYREMNEQLIELQKEIEDKNIDSIRRDLKDILDSKYTELKQVEIEIEKADCSLAEARKEELENELIEVGQKVADIESVLYVLEQFTKEKLNRVSNSINDMFKFVNFKLFSEQINGGMAECCEATINGVPFSSANNGARICAGLDIIKSISKHIGVSGPIFVDNVESVNDYKLPEMDSQLILLRVTDDKEINVEV